MNGKSELILILVVGLLTLFTIQLNRYSSTDLIWKRLSLHDKAGCKKNRIKIIGNKNVSLNCVARLLVLANEKEFNNDKFPFGKEYLIKANFP